MENVSDKHEGNNTNTLLATVLSKKEKKELLEKSQMFERLTGKQILTLMWWELFNKKRLDVFYHRIQIGKAAKFAYLDALHCR